MKQRYIILSLILFLNNLIANGQDSSFTNGTIFENFYLQDISSFSKLPLDSIWEFNKDTITNGGKAWQKVNTILLTDIVGKPIIWAGSGWFKKSFTVPDSLQGKAIAFRIGHYGVSEIYLDDKMVYQYGSVSSSSAIEKSIVPRLPVAVTLDKRPVHIWTVHFKNNNNNRILKPKLFSGFAFAMAPLSQSFLGNNITIFHVFVSIAFFIAFGLFFFFVYLFYPKRLASLMAAFVMFNFISLFFCGANISLTSDGNSYMTSVLIWRCNVILTNGFELLFFYAIYYGRFPRISWLILFTMILNVTNVIYPLKIDFILKYINILFIIEILRIIILGLWNKRTGFWILAVGKLIGTICFWVFVANVFNFFPNNEFSPLHEAGSFLSDLFVTLTFALQLAWEFRSSNRKLEKQLVQVKKLSDENLKQEQEKQHILAHQNETLEKQVTERTEALNQSLEDLKATQSKLIQSEKMASLGELTAGIAHEIQNPLNFVNNFSEVNTELIEEMKTELKAGNTDDAIAIANDIADNEQKINHHGKRADAIVKGMLQHSRSGGSIKEPTDINKLTDEYLRLAYHGLKAKDKSFNATLKTDFDETIGNINIVPQDIGRVILNLITNAFYAVTEKKKEGNTDYEPTVSVSTKKINGQLEIRVIDNGNGIPKKVIDKIFQPFFTTKPTGQGTGLGLSMSYDIVTKTHEGELKVETKEGEGSQFIIILPT
jgi:two-component system, NtrC family, sensor kinase